MQLLIKLLSATKDIVKTRIFILVFLYKLNKGDDKYEL